ncbi:MAG TPA: type II secretion system F family protein [Actinomycetota bacterium]|nr:type II secretion system F family protein [Actinomycetota bacterium]
MSELWLLVALVGTFLTIFLIGVIVDMGARERARPMTLLEAQIGHVSDSVNLRQDELSGSAVDRIFVPLGSWVGTHLRRLTPFDSTKRLEQLLLYAGSPPGWDAERVAALKIVGGIGGLLVALALGLVLPIGGIWRIVFIAIFTFVGYLIPGAYVGNMAKARQKAIQRQLPDVIDLLTISVEAGLGFDAALSQVVKNVPGPLAEEIARQLQEMQIGVSRSDAFRHLGERTDVQELNAFVLSMIQADLFGVSISNVLRAQSKELRVKRRQRAEEIAQKIPVKIIFPVIFCILPSLFVVVMGPGIIRFLETF